MSSRQANHQEDTFFRVLRILNEQPDITQRELAEKLGVSVSGLNYCIKALINKGFIKVRNFKNSSNKLGYLYLLTPAGVAQKTILTKRFLERKMQEYESIKKEIDLIANEIKLTEIEFGFNADSKYFQQAKN